MLRWTITSYIRIESSRRIRYVFWGTPLVLFDELWPQGRVVFEDKGRRGVDHTALEESVKGRHMYSWLTKAIRLKYMTVVAPYLAPCRLLGHISVPRFPGLSPAVTIPIRNTPVCLHDFARVPHKQLPFFRSIVKRSQQFLSISCSNDHATSPSSVDIPSVSAQTYLAVRPPLCQTWTSHTDLLQCSEPDGGSLRIAVLLSGGVDSSVALRLLLATGHQCTGYYLKIWFQEDFRNFWDECPWEEDLRFTSIVWIRSIFVDDIIGCVTCVYIFLYFSLDGICNENN